MADIVSNQEACKDDAHDVPQLCSFIGLLRILINFNPNQSTSPSITSSTSSDPLIEFSSVCNKLTKPFSSTCLSLLKQFGDFVCKNAGAPPCPLSPREMGDFASGNLVCQFVPIPFFCTKIEFIKIVLTPVNFTPPPPAGNFWVTGHDTDFHCSQGSPSPGASCHYLHVAVTFVMGGSTLPLLALDHGTQVHDAISNAFGATSPITMNMKTVDPRTGFTPDVVPLLDSSGKPLYSAIIIASDITCGGCDNNELTSTPDSAAINDRSDDIAHFYFAGGGLLALAGAKHRDVYYGFFGFPSVAVDVTPSSGQPGGFKLTSVGVSLGLTDSDINCCQTHNSFLVPTTAGTPQKVAEVDVAGNAETEIIKSR